MTHKTQFYSHFLKAVSQNILIHRFLGGLGVYDNIKHFLVVTERIPTYYVDNLTHKWVNPPAITGATDVWGLRHLLVTVFVIMNLIGAAEEAGVFLICRDCWVRFTFLSSKLHHPLYNHSTILIQMKEKGSFKSWDDHFSTREATKVMRAPTLAFLQLHHSNFNIHINVQKLKKQMSIKYKYKRKKQTNKKTCK